MIGSLANAVPGCDAGFARYNQCWVGVRGLWDEPERLQAWNSPVGVRGLGNTARYLGLGAVAETIHKQALTNQVKGLEAIKPAPSLTLVEDAERAIGAVEPWDDSSWWSGYDSTQGLRQRLAVLRGAAMANVMLGVAASSDSSENRRAAAEASEVLGSRDDLPAMFTTTAGYEAERAAKAARDAADRAANSIEIPTWLKVVGGLAVGGFALNAAAPYLGKR
jgi:hypothetical protein